MKPIDCVSRGLGFGAVLALALATFSPALAAGPEIVAGPAADAKCFAPWSDKTKFFKYPAKKGPFRIALANGYIANTWRIQMIQTAKAYASQPDVKAKLKEFKVVSTGEDVPAQISAINNFIDAGYDAIIVNAQNPTAFGPVIKRAKEAGVILVAFAFGLGTSRQRDDELQWGTVLRVLGVAVLLLLPWVIPSPNIPTPDTATVYPGQVLIEGTNLSEGRGTTKPFELFGAPWLDGYVLARELNAQKIPGAFFREAWFTPTFSKFTGERCGGCQLHVTDRERYAPVAAVLTILEVVKQLPGPKLELHADYFDKVMGTSSVREAFERGVPSEEIVSTWQSGLTEFAKQRAPFLLYGA